MRAFLLFALISCVSCVAALSKDAQFLADNALKPGVVTLPSGLQYKVLKAGPPEGKRPLVGTPCSCHYKGTTIDGTEFDSSIKRGEPTTFAPNQVIKGWTEAMQLMSEGSSWELFIPASLAYGNSQRGPHIYPGATLVFQLDLLKVLGPARADEL